MHGPNIGNTVTIDFEGGNAWGGKTKRQFQIGNGISAELQAGQFAHVAVRAITQLKEGEELFFSWTYDPVNRSDLYQYLSYDIAGLASKKATATVTVLSCLAGTQLQIGGNDAVAGAAQAVIAVNTGAVGGSGNFDVQDGGAPRTPTDIAARIVIAINGWNNPGPATQNLAGTGGVLASSVGPEITITCNTGGVAGNAKTLASTVPAELQIDASFVSRAGGANNQINLPEGCQTIIPESASNIVFEIPQFSTTFTQSALAGEEIPAIWGAISSNVTQNIIFRLRGV
jgi:hypothetical protein